MKLPLVLLGIALGAGVVLGYGTHPGWGEYGWGLGLILLSRRLLWPLAGVALLACLGLIGLVASGQRRAWWLIGLGPVLTLFVHRFASDPLREFAVTEEPLLVAAERAGFLGDEDYVVGLTFDGGAYAYPYAALYRWPVVFQSSREKRLVLLWSAHANRAIAFQVSRQMRAGDVEVVTMPANALLLYNKKLGEFINGLTGLTVKGARPTDFHGPVAVERVKWGHWKAQHPNTQVMSLGQDEKEPSGPLAPRYALPRLPSTRPAEMRVALVASTQPVALPEEQVSPRPLNIEAGPTPLLVFRDPKAGQVRVFDRRIEGKVALFRANANPRRPGVYVVDDATNTGWSSEGKAVDGNLGKQGKRLSSVHFEDALYWGVMKTWMPDLPLIDPANVQDPPALKPPPAPRSTPPTRSPARPTRPRRTPR